MPCFWVSRQLMLTTLNPQEISKSKDKELQLEVVAACLSVFTRLDSLL